MSPSKQTEKLSRLTEVAVAVCAVVLALGFALSGIVYFYLLHWRVVHQDYWMLYERYFATSWLMTAVLKFGGHSLFFPNLVWGANVRFFHGNEESLFFTGLALMLITVLLLFIPIWRDQTVRLTTKLIAILILVVASFWTVRSVIISSGGFNVICSLVTLSAALACLRLPKVSEPRSRTAVATFVLGAGFVASFSFAVGLAIWPTLLVLAWCLRAPMRTFILFAGGAVLSAIIYFALPFHQLNAQIPEGSLLSILATDLSWFFRLIGNPCDYAIFGWGETKSYFTAIEFSPLSFYCGMAGVLLALAAIVPELIKRDTGNSTLRLLGIALVLFTMCAFLLVTAGRAGRGLTTAVAPRYLFWSPFFWGGLFLVALQRYETKPLLRWVSYVAALAFPLLVFPSHYRFALIRINGMNHAEIGAMSLLNSVRDDQFVTVLFHDPEQVYRVAPTLRRKRLDIFAAGEQDWIGQNVHDLFREKQETPPFAGRCFVTAILTNDNGGAAARVTGQIATSDTCVIVDRAGTVRGLGRSVTICPWINRILFLGNLRPNQFAGYVRDYDPQMNYVLRAVEDGTVSAKTIAVGKKPAQ